MHYLKKENNIELRDQNVFNTIETVPHFGRDNFLVRNLTQKATLGFFVLEKNNVIIYSFIML